MPKSHFHYSLLSNFLIVTASYFIITTALIFLTYPIAASDVYNQEILNLKLKAIVSLELSSMTFNEVPGLYFLYDKFTAKRFQWVAKSEEEVTKLRTIHQYYGFQRVFYGTKQFRDVIMNEMVNLDQLDIYQGSHNWTEEEITKSQLLTSDGKFHDPDIANFFVAEYLHEKIFKPTGSATDDEVEIHLRLLFHILTDDFARRPILDEFIMSMVKDLKEPVFSDQIRMIMKYRFKYLLDTFLPNEIKDVDKILTVFERDREIIENLWGTDQNRPYFLRFFKYLSAPEKIKELKDIANKHFEIEAALDYGTSSDTSSQIGNSSSITKYTISNIFQGHNQKLNIIYLIHYHKEENFTQQLLEVTQTSISNQTLSQLNNTSKFLDFVDQSSLTRDEKREFYLAHCYDLISNTRNGTSLMTLWNRFEKLFTANELKEIITKKDDAFNQTLLFFLPSHSDFTYVQNFLGLTRRYLNHHEIRDFLDQRSPINRDSFLSRYLRLTNDVEIFESCWNFARRFMNHDELQDMLFGRNEQNFLQKIAGKADIFSYGMDIMAEFYTPDEIRESLMGKDERNETILVWIVQSREVKPVVKAVNYLRDIFKDHMDMLKDLLKTKDLYGKSLFENYRDKFYKHRLEPIKELAKEMLSEQEVEELGVDG